MRAHAIARTHQPLRDTPPAHARTQPRTARLKAQLGLGCAGTPKPGCYCIARAP